MSGARYGQRLTAREREIVGALCMGERPREITKRLRICHKTTETHLWNAKVKLGARTYPHLVYEYVTRYRSEP